MTLIKHTLKNCQLTMIYEYDGELQVEINNMPNHYILLPGNYEIRWKAMDNYTQPYLVINEKAYFPNDKIKCLDVYSNFTCEINLLL